MRRTLILNHWVGLGEDVSQYFIPSLFNCAPDESFRIMTNIEDLLDPNYILSDEEVLRARVQTFGAFKLSIGIKDFEYNFLDVGGVRFERCKWQHYYSHVNHIIFVISLPGYYQYLVEDGKTVSFFALNTFLETALIKSAVFQTQMREALRTFRNLTKIESLANMPIILFLNKTDLFMEHLVDIPISNYFLDFEGGSNYDQACQYFAQRFRKLDRRKNGKLFFYLTNAADTDCFKQTFRNLRLNILPDTSALQSLSEKNRLL